MNNARRVALWGGLAYLATFVFSMPAVGLLHPPTDNPAFVSGGGGNETQVLLGGIFEPITVFACVATALALYR